MAYTAMNMSIFDSGFCSGVNKNNFNSNILSIYNTLKKVSFVRNLSEKYFPNKFLTNDTFLYFPDKFPINDIFFNVLYVEMILLF